MIFHNVETGNKIYALKSHDITEIANENKKKEKERRNYSIGRGENLAQNHITSQSTVKVSIVFRQNFESFTSILRKTAMKSRLLLYRKGTLIYTSYLMLTTH